MVFSNIVHIESRSGTLTPCMSVRFVQSTPQFARLVTSAPGRLVPNRKLWQLWCNLTLSVAVSKRMVCRVLYLLHD